MINLNEAFEDELYFKYLRDPDSVSPEWQEYFEKVHGKSVFPLQSPKTFQQRNIYSQSQSNVKDSIKRENSDDKLKDYEELEELSKVQAEYSIQLEDSLSIPSASSSRTIPVKALDENKRIINRYQKILKRKNVTFTHILAWAIVKSLIKFPNMNDSYAEIEGKPYRIVRNSLNVGLAIDITKNDGTRLLLVPNVKNVENMDFKEFFHEFQNLIEKTRNFALKQEDLEGTSVTLTNPGMIGTTFSLPKLLKGQGAIISTGLIDYPAEFKAVNESIKADFALSKVVTITNTYDHRIIQGAESAEFLAYLNKLLIGEERFYDQIFYSLNVPFEPVRWSDDNSKYNSYYSGNEEKIEKGAHVMQMINAYRVRGHLLANTNPLGFDIYYYPELDPAYYGFTIWDLDRVFHADDKWHNNNLQLRDIIELLRESYCGTIGYEFMHIQSPEKKNWIKEKVELTRNKIFYSKEEKIHTLKKLIGSVFFEEFLHTKFVGHKRFSLQGAESTIVALDKIFEKAADSSLHSVVLGMAHRGRLNVLVNNVGKPIEHIFKEFDDDFDPKSYKGVGDVKYHLGDKGYYISPNNNSLNILLSPNPSHLELVDPVINGMARALDNEIKDESYTKVLPVVVHGDAAFAGQGIVAETLNLAQLEGYKTGGTVHIIINNQIGFTTTIEFSRSTVYATDIAKMTQVPILHVNGNDPEAVRNAANFAFEYREQFGTDVIIDIICFRKYGHNEGDEPSYTQPLLYKKVRKMSDVAEVYANQLIDEGILSDEDVKQYKNSIQERLNNAFISSKDYKLKKQVNYLTDGLSKLSTLKTGFAQDKLTKIANALSSYPSNFNIHPKVLKVLERRKKIFEDTKPSIDWALAESLAIGSVLTEGNEVRFTGQDSRRGTFSQRHSVLIDNKNEEAYIPLNNISQNQALLRIFDSPLSEIACLGFEYGYSVIAENGLTFWEAQFGDFANNAQSIFDQFISCGETKWGQTSNLIMLLPHSYDGQGPEHSSARMERYLQLCANNNMFVANFTTPAQYFHAIRRHHLMSVKIPMVIMTPKSMLRNPLAVSSIDDLAFGKLEEIIDHQGINNPSDIKRILLTSGKIYYELLDYYTKNQINDTAIIRIEQLYPFRYDLLIDIINKYQNNDSIVWVQEEPKNMGAWNFISSMFYEKDDRFFRLKYAGRAASSSTATGSMKIHLAEQQEIMQIAFKI
jgi:2-oxoglutarate decarboxylase